MSDDDHSQRPLWDILHDDEREQLAQLAERWCHHLLQSGAQPHQAMGQVRTWPRETQETL